MGDQVQHYSLGINYRVLGKSGIVEALPETNQQRHRPNVFGCDCQPIAGLSICGGCHSEVKIFVHREPAAPDAIARIALKIIGNKIKEGNHEPGQDWED